MYMFIIFERNYHRKLLQKTRCNYLLPFWNCDIFFTATKICILIFCSKNGRNLIVNISKTKARRLFFFAYLERACRNWPNHEFSWKNHLVIPTVSYSLKKRNLFFIVGRLYFSWNSFHRHLCRQKYANCIMLIKNYFHH